MKVVIMLFTLTMFVFSSRSQEYQYVSFPDSNSVWSEYYWSSESPAVYNKFALFNEDTLINGITYKKLFHTANHSSITPENSSCIGGIREDSLNRVFASISIGGFVTPETQEILLYDFNLNEGDTIRRYISDKVTANFSADFLVVEDIDTIEINNSTRKVFSFLNYPWTRWIEGIGNAQGLAFPSGDLTTGGDNSELICMHQNDTLMYFNDEYEGCVPQFVIDNVAILPNYEIKVYPNPVYGGSVHFENLQFETFELYDAHGQLTRKNTIHGSTKFVLDASELTPGIYTYRLITIGLIPTQGKLIVQ